MKNNQKGITLIALVVTIIVLLILAGVSIAMLTGQNGILNRGQEAAQKNAVADTKDQIALKVAECITNWNAAKYAGTTISGIDEDTDIDTYIYDELSDMEASLESANGVTITLPTVSDGDPADSAKIEIAGSNGISSSCTWTDGGVLSAWTDVGM